MRRRTILIIDDYAPWLRMAAGKFALEQYEVYTARSCAEGIRLVEERRPDCVLLDFHLQDGTAFNVCSAIRSNESVRKTPIIVISGDPDQELLAHTKCQADYFVAKGSSFENIKAIVEGVLRRVSLDCGIIEKGDIRLERETLSVFRTGKRSIKLFPDQFRFFALLVTNTPHFVNERTICREAFMMEWTPEKNGAIKERVYRVRASLGVQLAKRIINQRGFGWAYAPPAYPHSNRKPVSREIS
jgi:two-component system alkaline phosphatase synthesis response regulator PhoP